VFVVQESQSWMPIISTHFWVAMHAAVLFTAAAVARNTQVPLL